VKRGPENRSTVDQRDSYHWKPNERRESGEDKGEVRRRDQAGLAEV